MSSGCIILSENVQRTRRGFIVDCERLACETAKVAIRTKLHLTAYIKALFFWPTEANKETADCHSIYAGSSQPKYAQRLLRV